ncbi:MAG TPA: zinc ribbon domain-containing protein [Sumerlaeia bacterium]|nr:zinc ribbon domain-containing protein [Sumerlaeia bacterium]
MTDPTQVAAQNYVCSKCRGRQPVVREIVLAKSGLLDLLPSKDNRYIEVTCALCGYTEFYNRAIYLASLSPEQNRRKMPLPAEES